MLHLPRRASPQCPLLLTPNPDHLPILLFPRQSKCPLRWVVPHQILLGTRLRSAVLPHPGTPPGTLPGQNRALRARPPGQNLDHRADHLQLFLAAHPVLLGNHLEDLGDLVPVLGDLGPVLVDRSRLDLFR